MDEKRLKIMIERFFDAQLSIEEERELYCYLRENDVPAELRKDKQAIIALCSEPSTITSSDEALMRLEAMIDALGSEQQTQSAASDIISAPKKKIIKIPRFVYRGVAAAAIFALCLIIFTNTPQQRDCELATMTEEDTFDTPEEALECVKASFDLVLMAANTTNHSSRAIGNTLEQAIAIHSKKDISNR